MKKILIVSLMAILLLTLTACCKGSEKDRFINATIEVGCTMFQDENFFSDLSQGEERTRAIFAKYDFDANNDEEMAVVSGKYQQDTEVKQRVQDGIKKCAGDIFNKNLFEQAGTEAVTTEAVTTEPVTTEPAATVTK